MQYVSTPGPRGICPEGWHIPTNEEFLELSNLEVEKSNALKAVGQGRGIGVGTNMSGFSGLLAGYRNYDGFFNDLSYNAYFWSSTEESSSYARGIYLSYNDSHINFDMSNKDYGFSVRCIKD